MAEQSQSTTAVERDALRDIPLSRIVVPDGFNPRGAVVDDAELEALAETIRQRVKTLVHELSHALVRA